MLEGKRKAIIIGINKYDDTNIPELRGAENDATEIFNRLSDPNIGNFTLSTDHLLIGPNATSANVRTAISDVLWNQYDNDLVLIYFSGHGFTDGYDEGYLAPYDMIKYKPLVYGIRMKELGEIISRSMNKSILLIMDCCYSGIATRGSMKEPFNLDINDLARKGTDGGVRMVLASSQADALSKEIFDVKHTEADVPHAHGSFTLALIDGLDGKASDEYGMIKIDSLRDFLENEMAVMGKQKPQYFVQAEASLLNSVVIAVSPIRYKKNLLELTKEIEDYLDANDIQALHHATLNIQKLSDIEPTNPNITSYKVKINESLQKFQPPILQWLDENMQTLRNEVNKISPYLYVRLFALVEYLSLEKITKMSPVEFRMLLLLSDFALSKTNEDKSSGGIHSFITYLKAVSRQPHQ